MIVAVGLLNGCASSSDSSRAIIPLTEADSGRSIDMRVGETLDLRLPSNPTTGFQWEIETLDQTILRPDGEPAYAADNQAVGSGGEMSWHFVAQKAGQTKLRLICHRAFEPDVPPVQIFEVMVTVK